jgi:hypothetical protein
MSKIRYDQPDTAAQLDAVAAALAARVHAALDVAPSERLIQTVRAAAARRQRHPARIAPYAWRLALSAAAAGVLAVGAWSFQHHRQVQRLQLLDHLLVLTATPEASDGDLDAATESLAQRLLLLQGLDAEATMPEAAEAPAPPATDVQSRNRCVLPARKCV